MERLPEWFRVPSPLSAETNRVRRIVQKHGLNTVCQSAACPNLGHCFAAGTATFMILGSSCTRNCRFCAVPSGPSQVVDGDEPARLVKAAKELGLRHVVITSVTRDDLADGGASQFKLVIDGLQQHVPEVTVEVLTPDFLGNLVALKTVVEARPDIFNHNLETVPRLYETVRPEANYQRSLAVLGMAKRFNREVITKSGLIVGLGETGPEVEEVLRDIRKAGCDMVTIGQYLQPSRKHLPVVEYIPPVRFNNWADYAKQLGFTSVFAGPLVRSSFHAADTADELRCLKVR